MDPWLAASRDGFDVRFVVLRPAKKTAIERAVERQAAGALVNPDVVGRMWQFFGSLGQYETNVVDTTNQSIDESVSTMKKRLSEGGLHLL